MDDNVADAEMPEAHWMYKGRQSHGWFGSGTAPPKAPAAPDGLFDPSNAAARVDDVAGRLKSQLPETKREFPGAEFDAAARTRLKTSVAAWYGASALSRDAFRDRLLPWYVSDATVDHLRNAAKGMVEARDKKALSAAGANLAFSMQKIGMEWWPTFLVQAEKRAISAVSKGLIPGVTKSGETRTNNVPGNIVLGALSLRDSTKIDSSVANSKDSSLGPGNSGLLLAKTLNEGSTNTWFVNPGSGQMRFYGPNGYPAVDIDSDHDHGSGVPHMHIWIPVPGGRPRRGLPIFPVPF
jgi:hypothetical protein